MEQQHGENPSAKLGVGVGKEELEEEEKMEKIPNLDDNASQK
jgi:hypothetical protein